MKAILTYHSIDPSGSPISLDAAVFAEHVRWLASGRVRVVPLAELRALPPEVDGVALTFDDGFRNFAELAAPLLREHALPATVFVVTAHVGGTNAWEGAPSIMGPVLPLLRWEELGALAADGVEIGAHTRRHPRLAFVRGAALEDEIAGAAECITAELGVRPESFAYPYGSVSLDAVEIVRRTYRRACTTALRAIGTDDDDALLPRLDMYYLRTRGQLESWGSPRFRRHLWVRANARRIRRIVSSAGDLM